MMLHKPHTIPYRLLATFVIILFIFSQFLFLLNDSRTNNDINYSKVPNKITMPTFSQTKNQKKIVILFDETHVPAYTISMKNPSYDGTGTGGGGGYTLFAEAIKNQFDPDIRTLDATVKYSEYRKINEGLHWVSTGNEITNTTLKDVDLLIIPASIGNYTPSELGEIARFVKNGGSLLLIGEGVSSNGIGTYASGVEYVAEKFGVKVGGTVKDTANGIRFNEDGSDVVDFDYIQFNSTLMGKHQITDNLSAVEFFRGWHFLFPPYGSTSLIYSSSSATPPDSPVALAIPTCRITGEGRIVMVGDGGMFKDYMVGEVGNNGDEDHDGIVDINDAENKNFAMNIIRWLTYYYDFNICFTETDTPETFEKTVGPNQSVEYPIKIKNIGHCVNNDAIDFKIEGLPTEWAYELKRGSENISSITMTAGEEANLTLRITTPDEMSNTTVTTIITGTSRNDANATHNITAITNLQSIYNITVCPSEEQITVLPGNAARYFLNITNNGTIIDEFGLKIENASGAYAVIEGGVTEFLLLPYQTTALKLFVVPQAYTPPATILHTTLKLESKRGFGNISVPLTAVTDTHHSIDTSYYIYPYTKNDTSVVLTITLTNRGNVRENVESNISTDRPTESVSVQNIIGTGDSVNIPFSIVQPPPGETNNIYVNVTYAGKKSTLVVPVSSAKTGAILKTYNSTLYTAKDTILKIPVLIKNTGNLKDVFILSVSSKFTNWSIENYDSNIISLDPVSSRTVYVAVQIPPDADTVLSTIWINATSQLNPEINASQTINVVIKPILELSDLRIDRRTIKNGDNIKIIAGIKNWKDEKLNVTVSFTVDGEIMESKHLNEFSNSTQLQFSWIAKEGKHKIELKTAVDGIAAQTDGDICGYIDVENAPALPNQTLLFLIIVIIASISTVAAIRRWEK